MSSKNVRLDRVQNVILLSYFCHTFVILLSYFCHTFAYWNFSGNLDNLHLKAILKCMIFVFQVSLRNVTGKLNYNKGNIGL